MATNQQRTETVSSIKGPTIDNITTVSPVRPSEDISGAGAPDSSNEKFIYYTTQNAKLMKIRSNSAADALPENTVPEIDNSSSPAMVTPLKQLQRDPALVDCTFCKQMAMTKVQHKEESEEPSGYVQRLKTISKLIVGRLMICVVCLVCWPLLLCLPSMMGTTESWSHACSNCNTVVAIRGQHGEVEVKEPLPLKVVPSKYGAAKNMSKAESVAPVQNGAKAQ